jgi:hypothetical protein
MQEAVEAIETENRESEENRPETERSGPYDTRPDPDWWQDFYGEGIEP